MKSITDMFNKYVQVYLDRSGFWNYRSQYFRNEDILKQQLDVTVKYSAYFKFEFVICFLSYLLKCTLNLKI